MRTRALPTTLFGFLTDRVLPDLDRRPARPGRKAVLRDAELLCVVVAQRLLHAIPPKPDRWVRYASTHLSGLFPEYRSNWDATNESELPEQ